MTSCGVYRSSGAVLAAGSTLDDPYRRTEITERMRKVRDEIAEEEKLQENTIARTETVHIEQDWDTGKLLYGPLKRSGRHRDTEPWSGVRERCVITPASTWTRVQWLRLGVQSRHSVEREGRPKRAGGKRVVIELTSGDGTVHAREVGHRQR